MGKQAEELIKTDVGQSVQKVSRGTQYTVKNTVYAYIRLILNILVYNSIELVKQPDSRRDRLCIAIIFCVFTYIQLNTL